MENSLHHPCTEDSTAYYSYRLPTNLTYPIVSRILEEIITWQVLYPIFAYPVPFLMSLVTNMASALLVPQLLLSSL